MNRITTGAYLIRNMQHYKLLHVAGDSENEFRKVKLNGRDENLYRDRQIWWVEPDPDIDEDEIEVYSITNIRTGKAFQRDNSGWDRGVGAGLIIEDRVIGSKKQMWEIRRSILEEEMFYDIVNTSEGDVALDTGAAHDGWPLRTWYPKEHNSSQRWEFIVPVVGIPAGWIQIKNFATGHLLSHNRLSSNPAAVPPPSPSIFWQFKESWALQWRFSARLCRAGTNNCNDPETVEWIIENRLTGGILYNTYGSQAVLQAVEKEDHTSGGWMGGLWHPELSSDGHWVIRSRMSNSNVLEEIETKVKYKNNLVVESNPTEEKTIGKWVVLPSNGLASNEKSSIWGGENASLNVSSADPDAGSAGDKQPKLILALADSSSTIHQHRKTQ